MWTFLLTIGIRGAASHNDEAHKQGEQSEAIQEVNVRSISITLCLPLNNFATPICDSQLHFRSAFSYGPTRTGPILCLHFGLGLGCLPSHEGFGIQTAGYDAK